MDIIVMSFKEARSFNNKNRYVVNTTSRTDNDQERTLSPFYAGPVELYNNYVAKNVENAWQFSKVYKKHLTEKYEPSQDYWDWALKGWSDNRAHRYPMGKGSTPEYSYWDGERLDYIQGRKKIYVPLYAKAVVKTEGYKVLKNIVDQDAVNGITLLDFDANIPGNHDMSKTLNNPKKKMGHAFVLRMMLTKDPALRECGVDIEELEGSL